MVVQWDPWGEPGGPLGGTWDRCTGADSGFPIWQVHRKELQAGVDIIRHRQK